MNSALSAGAWPPGAAPVAVVMITLNEAHNLEACIQSLKGWAQEVFIVDSYSQDNTVSIALAHGIHIVQRAFRGYGDQWNFALDELPIQAPWTMKLDPDERLSPELKEALLKAMIGSAADGLSLDRQLWMMGRRLPVYQPMVRVWRSGCARFSDVAVNEHVLVDGPLVHVAGCLEHHDSPDLDHWLEKQNRYTTAEAIIAYQGSRLAAEPRLLGNSLERRMWLKRHFSAVPFRYFLVFIYFWVIQGAWRAGWVGYAWARLRSDVFRLIDYKRREIQLTGRLPTKRVYGAGAPDPRVRQYP